MGEVLLLTRRPERVSEPPLCGAEILGILAFGEFDLCLVCRELNGGDPRAQR